MKTAARNFARTVVALAAVGVVAILNGCGAAPDGHEEKTGATQEAVSSSPCLNVYRRVFNRSDPFELSLANLGCTNKTKISWQDGSSWFEAICPYHAADAVVAQWASDPIIQSSYADFWITLTGPEMCAYYPSVPYEIVNWDPKGCTGCN